MFERAVIGDKRRERQEARVQSLEAEYKAQLRAALEACAAGAWGLFGQNEYVPAGPAEAYDDLCALADRIDAERIALGDVPFVLHQRFLELRGRQGGNQPGEPKIAKRLLEELGA